MNSVVDNSGAIYIIFIYNFLYFYYMAKKSPSSGAAKRSILLHLSDTEMLVLEALAEKRGISKSAVLRQALRLYESVETRLDQGERLYLESPNKKDKSELLLI